MESFYNQRFNAHWDHEPKFRSPNRNHNRNPLSPIRIKIKIRIRTRSRFMESTVSSTARVEAFHLRPGYPFFLRESKRSCVARSRSRFGLSMVPDPSGPVPLPRGEGRGDGGTSSLLCNLGWSGLGLDRMKQESMTLLRLWSRIASRDSLESQASNLQRPGHDVSPGRSLAHSWGRVAVPHQPL